MRRSPATPSQSSPSTSLHPALQAIFENLDLRLEDELARYRRQQGRRGVAPALQNNRRSDLMPPPADVRSLPSSWNESPSGVAEPRPSLRLAPDADRNTDLHRALPDLRYAPNPDPRPELLLGGAIAPQHRVPPTADSGAIPLHRPPDHDLYPGSGLEAEPDDYLESSEYLLRNLTEDERDLRASQQEPGMLQSLLTPLGIGSMILLLLSSLSFGYLVMNPAGLGVIGLGDTSRTTADGSTPGADAGTDSTLSADAGTGNSSISPDLSAQEFPEVSLDTLSTLPSGRSAILNEPSAGADSAAESPVLSGSPLPAEAPAAPAEPLTERPAASSQSASSQSAPSRSAPSRSVPSQSAPSQSAPFQSADRSPSSNPAPTRPASRTSSPARPQPSASSSRSESRPSTATAAAPAPRSSAPSPASRAAEPAPRPAPSPEPTVPQEVATAPRQPAIAPTPAAAASNRYYVVVDFSGDRSLEQARE
ncbi:MAG: hypothetical protein SNJ57_20185, partial [Cyanobacteriota bacterium]